MAIVIEQVITSRFAGATDTTSVTGVSGEKVLILVHVNYVSASDLSSVAYNGSTLTAFATSYNSGLSQRKVVGFIANAVVGAANVVTTMTSGFSTQTVIIRLSGLHASAPIRSGSETTASAATGGAPPTISVSSAAGDLVLAAFSTPYAGTLGSTATFTYNSYDATVDFRASMIQASGSSGSVSMAITDSNNFGGAGLGFSLTPAAGALTTKLKVLLHPDAASATGVAGAVFDAPTGGALFGAPIGEFTGAAFESSLEGGEAVLKVAVSAFGGTALTTADAPVVYLENSTKHSRRVVASVIEE